MGSMLQLNKQWKNLNNVFSAKILQGLNYPETVFIVSIWSILVTGKL